MVCIFIQDGHSGSKQHSHVQKFVIYSLGWNAHLILAKQMHLSFYYSEKGKPIS
jgi:hypothetical protein